MAAINTTKAPDNSTNANFRAWGKAISDQFLAGGWVQTSDSSQVNWATVTAPATTFTIGGYEIWRSNDGAGSLNELYVKIEYCSGGAAATPAIAITVGWGSDGAGNLVGLTSTRKLNYNTTSSSSSLLTCNIAIGQGWIAIMMFWASTSYYNMIIVERTRDASLAEQNEFIKLMYSTSNVSSQVVTRTGTSGGLATGVAYPVETSPWSYGLIPNGATITQSGNVGVGLIFGQKGGFTPPMMNVFGAYSTTAGAAGTTQVINVNGANHTYIVNPVTTSIGFLGSNSNPWLSRFE